MIRNYWELHALWLTSAYMAFVIAVAMTFGIEEHNDDPQPITVSWETPNSTSDVPQGEPLWGISDTSNPKCSEHESRMCTGRQAIVLKNIYGNPVRVSYRATYRSDGEELSSVDLVRTIPPGADRFQLPWEFRLLGADQPPYRNSEVQTETVTLDIVGSDYQIGIDTHVVTLPARKPIIRLATDPSNGIVVSKLQIYLECSETLPKEQKIDFTITGDAVTGGYFGRRQNSELTSFAIPKGKSRSEYITLEKNAGKHFADRSRFIDITIAANDSVDMPELIKRFECPPYKLPRLVFKSFLQRPMLSEGESTTLTVRLIEGILPAGFPVACTVMSPAEKVACKAESPSEFTSENSTVQFTVTAQNDNVAFEDPETLTLNVIAAEETIPVTLAIIDATEAVLTTSPSQKEFTVKEGPLGAAVTVKLPDGVTAAKPQTLSWTLKGTGDKPLTPAEISKQFSGLTGVVGPDNLSGTIQIPAGKSETTLSIVATLDQVINEPTQIVQLAVTRPNDAYWTWKPDSVTQWDISIIDPPAGPTVGKTLILVVANRQLQKYGIELLLDSLNEFAASIRIVDASKDSPHVYTPGNTPEVVPFANDPKSELTGALSAWNRVSTPDGPSVTIILWMCPENPDFESQPDWKDRPPSEFRVMWLGGKDASGFIRPGLPEEIMALDFEGLPAVQPLTMDEIKADSAGAVSLLLQRMRGIINKK